MAHTRSKLLKRMETMAGNKKEESTGFQRNVTSCLEYVFPRRLFLLRCFFSVLKHNNNENINYTLLRQQNKQPEPDTSHDMQCQ